MNSRKCRSFFSTDHKLSETLYVTKIKFKIDNCLIMTSGDAICMREADYGDGKKTDAIVTRIDGKPMVGLLRSIRRK